MFPKKIKACILFLLLTVLAALGAVWCAKHAYRYHLAVHPLPYYPEQGALLEKHRQVRCDRDHGKGVNLG